MNRPVVLILLSLTILTSLPSRADSPTPAVPAERKECSPAREYVTVHGFLSDRKDLGFDAAQARQIADRVSLGCTGAARRFISVFLLLEKLEVGSRDALKQGLAFARGSDARVDSFRYVLRTAYLGDSLDMDLATSLKLAHDLSDEYKGVPENAERDFRQLVDFCLSENGLGLPPPQCGRIAGRITKQGENFTTRTAPAFISTFRFLRSETSLHLSVAEGLKSAEDIVAQSPAAAENFTIAYRYGMRTDGLDLSAKDSLTFARQIAARSLEAAPAPEPPEDLRLPASSGSSAKPKNQNAKPRQE